jgi:hypothetical protein
MDTARIAHHDQHLVPARVVESRLAAFQIGHSPLGAVFNRVGGVGGTEESADGHHVAGAAREAAELAESGRV